MCLTKAWVVSYSLKSIIIIIIIIIILIIIKERRNDFTQGFLLCGAVYLVASYASL